MESTKEGNNLHVASIKEKENLIEELKHCQKYFHHSADIVPLLTKVPVFYEHLRIIIDCIQKMSTELELEVHVKEIIQDISVSLLKINASCCLQLDDQLLCSTAFSSILCKLLEADKLKVLFSSFLTTNDCTCVEFNNVPNIACVENLEMFKLCLCHGILQSTALTKISQTYGDDSDLYFIMFDLLEELCMKYSKMTSISFKTLVTWINKVCLDLKLRLSTNNLRRIFAIINSNWESPIHGVREQNTKMFELFLSACSLSSSQALEYSNIDSVFQSPENLTCHIMREQSWKMKSKYFMLGLLLQQYGVRKGFTEFPNIVYGLVSSLSHSHLTTAGSELYRSCLKSLYIEDWIDIFLTPIVAVMTDKRDIVSIEKQNLFNYWIPVTLKTFPSLLNVLLEQLIDVSDLTHCENTMFSIISLLKLGRKGGTLLSVWNEEFAISTFTFVNFLNLLQYALEHSNENIRAEAFAVVCCSTKTRLIPFIIEFELVQKFLINNVNIDSALLRQSILNYFTLFLVRVLNSSLFEIELKNNQHINKPEPEFFNSERLENCSSNGISQNINFLEWLYYFLTSNLQPGVNYQRKILSLQLFKVILSYFGESSQEIKHKIKIKRKGNYQGKRGKIVEYATILGKWHFNCPRNCKLLLSCVLDPTDDIREIAGLILTEHFGLQEDIIHENRGLLDFALELCASPVFYETESGALLFKVISNWTYKIPKNVSQEFVSNITEIKYAKCVDKINEVIEEQSDSKFKRNISKSFGSSVIRSDQERLMSALCQVINRSEEEEEDKISEVTNLKVVASIPTGMDRDYNKDGSPIQATNSLQSPEESETVGICFCSEIDKTSVLLKKENAEIYFNCVRREDATESSGLEPTCVKCFGNGKSIVSGNDNIESLDDQENKLKLDCVQAGVFPMCSDNSMTSSDLSRNYVTSRETQTPTINVSEGLHKSSVERNVEEEIYNSVAPLSLFLLFEAERQFSHLKNDILQAITSGSPLHGTLGALAQISIQVNGPEFGCMSTMEIDRTVSLLEKTVTYLLNLLAVKSASTNDVAPSFAEMDEAIKFSIQNSIIYLEISKAEDMHLSPAHQLVLNCIWRNLKPLLQMCISQLLDIANTPVDREVAADPEAVLTDLPQAQSLHFLRILVQDSSLKQDIAQYMSSIAILCFTHFSSPLWTIRNAALQLSGTLIPKLVGQKKIQDEEVTIGSNISTEAFFSHFPELTDFILACLKKAANCHQSEVLQQHADLIPMLSLLAKVTIGFETFISMPLEKKIYECRDCFLQLLDSPIYHVRKLAAKAYERFVSLTNTYETIVFLTKKLNVHNDNCNSTDCSCSHQQNKVNGILLALKYLVEKIKFESQNVTEMQSYLLNIGTVLKNITKEDKLCILYTYFNKLLFIELMDLVDVEVVVYSYDYAHERILQVHRIIEEEKNKPSFKPGLFLWAAKIIDQNVRKCCPKNLVIIWYNSYMLFNTYPEIIRSSFNSLKTKIETDESIDCSAKSCLLIALLKIMLERTKDYPIYILSPLLNVMLLLLQDPEVNIVVTLKEVETIGSWCFKCNIIALPVVAQLLSRYLALTNFIELSDSDLKFILELIKYVEETSEAIEYGNDHRLNIAKSVNLLASSLRTTFVTALNMCKDISREEMLKYIIKTLLNILLDLLQDEDQDVRKEAAKFIPLCSEKVNELEQNPYSCLQNIIHPSVLLSLLPVTSAIEFLWDKLCYSEELQDFVTYKDNKNYKDCSVTNPFDIGISNIYREGTMMVDLFGNSLLHILQEAKPLEKRKLKEIIYNRSLSLKDDVTTVISLLDTIQQYGILSTSPEHTVIYIIAKKIVYFSKLMTCLEVKNSDVERIIQDLKYVFA